MTLMDRLMPVFFIGLFAVLLVLTAGLVVGVALEVTYQECGQ